MNLKNIIPMLLSVIALIALLKTFITPQMLQTLFSGAIIPDLFIGTAIGGISVGQPFLSYIIGGELLQSGVSLYGVSAFILSFVTLGVIQLPFEIAVFGARFTLIRNILAFVFALLIAFTTTYSLKLLQ